MRVLIIANPTVGINREKRMIVENIASHIRKKGGSVDVAYVMKPGMGRKYSSRAALEGYDAVYAAGGDGTINDVASGLVDRKLPFGIIPLGTGNGLARGLNIPFDQESLIRMFDANKTIMVDAGRIGPHFFFSVAGIGYEVFIAEDFNKRMSPNRKMHTLFYLAIKNYFTRRPEKLTITFDGVETTRKLFGLTICNTGQYGSGAVIAPQASAVDGKLTAVLIPKMNPFTGLFAAVKLFNSTINQMRTLEYHDFKSLKIKREKPGLFEVDGETYSGGNVLNVTVMSAALKAIVP